MAHLGPHSYRVAEPAFEPRALHTSLCGLSHCYSPLQLYFCLREVGPRAQGTWCCRGTSS